MILTNLVLILVVLRRLVSLLFLNFIPTLMPFWLFAQLLLLILIIIMNTIKPSTTILNASKFKLFNLLLCKRCIQTIKIGVIGSGPAGFYTTQALLKV